MTVRGCLPALLLLLPLAAALVTGASLVPPAHADYPTPLQQVRDWGVSPEDVQCNAGLVHAVRANGAHVCVREATAGALGWEIFAAEEAAPAGAGGRGTIPGASPPAELVGDGRGVETTAPPEPPAPVQSPAEGGPAAAGGGPSEDAGPEAQPYDPRYYAAGGKITLQYVERKIPNPTGVWMPITKEEAEQVVMPRLAAAIGDRLILPEMSDYEYCVRTPLSDCPRFLDESDPDSLSYYPYNTEKGNIFYAAKGSMHPDLIHRITYSIRDWLPYDEREEFFRSLMERAGFNVTKVYIGDINGSIYGGMVRADLEFLPPYMDLIFRGWTNDHPEGYRMSDREVERRAHDFAAAHTDLWDEEKCTLRLHNVDGVDVISQSVKAGVLTFRTVVGYCYYPDNLPLSQSVIVEGSEGEIIWPRMKYYLVEDWIDRIDIPESAKVKHSSDADGGGP